MTVVGKAATADELKTILKHPIAKKEPYVARPTCKVNNYANNAVGMLRVKEAT